MSTEDFDYYYDLYEEISLEDYLKDKSVEDIISTCKWLYQINRPVFYEMLAYFNKEPREDLKYTETTDKFCDNSVVCSKCLFPHDNSHKCYAYDRIFRNVFLNSCDYDYLDEHYAEYGNHYENGRDEYGHEDYGCRGTFDAYIRTGNALFERKCQTCPVMIQITKKYWL